MIEFIAKYWIQFLFGLITAGMGIFCKQVWKLYKNEKQHQKSTEQKKFYDDLISEIRQEREYSDQKDKILQGQVDDLKNDLTVVKDGILSVQGKNFREECRFLLQEDHHITLDEFEQITADHVSYNGLGGNHRGDELYRLVKKKFESTL